MSIKMPKWDIGETVEAGKKSTLLANEYASELNPRLRKDELTEHNANVTELESRRAGQQQNLVTQKSKTLGQDTEVSRLNTAIVDIRNIPRSNSAPEEIKKAFGVGEKIALTIPGVTAAAKIVLDAFKKYPEWSKDAGILESDMTRLTAMMNSLSNAGQEQDDSMYTRKAKTMDKDVLQRTVEDEVTRLSSLGALAFRESKPGVSSLFEDLIPKAHQTPSEVKPTPGKTSAEEEKNETK